MIRQSQNHLFRETPESDPLSLPPSLPPSHPQEWKLIHTLNLVIVLYIHR